MRDYLFRGKRKDGKGWGEGDYNHSQTTFRDGNGTTKIEDWHYISPLRDPGILVDP
jgi:hypothetical protein